MLKWPLFTLYLFSFVAVCAQNDHRFNKCGWDEMVKPHVLELYENDPNKIPSVNFNIAQYKQLDDHEILTLPIVFHVLYNTPEQNISDEQILAQLDALNRDFRRQNPDSVLTPPEFRGRATDTRIQFCLAQQTPDGLISNGINRKEVNQEKIGVAGGNYYKPNAGGIQIWDPRKYVNVWVCETEDDIGGFTYLPGVAAANFDGIVLSYLICGDDNFLSGPFNQGRTLVHEVGHWLGLKHLWGDDEGNCNIDDGIPDTPIQEFSTSGCPSSTILSCNNGPEGNMYMNYMDYTYDQCQNSFTSDQKLRMRGVLNPSVGERKLLSSSIGCNFPDTSTAFVSSIDIFPNPAQEYVNLRFNFESLTQVDVFLYDIAGRIVYSDWYLVTQERITIDLSPFSNGAYFIQVDSHVVSNSTKLIKAE